MAAQIIDGHKLSQILLSRLKAEAAVAVKKYQQRPGLVTILVGENPASLSYVALKLRSARQLGYYDVEERLAAGSEEAQLLKLIDKYNQTEDIHGLLVQLPLPPHFSTQRVLERIAPHKDVDGLHPHNLGKLFSGYQSHLLGPCTPLGIMEMLRHFKLSFKGKQAVVLGRSNIVGKPMAALLAQPEPGADATVTLIHSASRNTEPLVRRADLVVVAVGRPGFLRGSALKPGAVVIDVGVTRVAEKITSTGKKIPILKGDVDFETALETASYLTPVPGGVGPMTIAMLMKNTLTAFKNQLRSKRGFH